MSNSFDKFQKRRLITSYFSVVLSITLVLFLLGGLGLSILKSKQLEKSYKEELTMSIYLKNTAKKIDVDQLEKTLKLSDKFAKNCIQKDLLSKTVFALIYIERIIVTLYFRQISHYLKKIKS